MRFFFLTTLFVAACSAAAATIPNAADAGKSGDDDAAVGAETSVDARADVDDGDAGGLVFETIAPADTDPAIVKFTEDHLLVRDPSVPTLRVLVFFPGSTFLPTQYRYFLSAAARQGYAAIGLNYPNNVDVKDVIDDSDPDCTKLAREEILDGTDHSALVMIDAKDSIIHRVAALFVYLDTKHPGEGWAALAPAGEPNWSQVAVAGHSFGSGMATLIALENATPRMVAIAGPNDHCKGDAATPAPWLVATGGTPPSARFGFAHLQDDEEGLQLAAWGLLGMDAFGVSVNVQLHDPPYEGSHELKGATDPPLLPDGGIGDAHKSTAVNLWTPLDAGVPVFEPAWRYAVGP